MLIKIIVFYCELSPGMSTVGKDWQIVELIVYYGGYYCFFHMSYYIFVYFSHSLDLGVLNTLENLRE